MNPLQDLGFTPRETKVYLALLELGPSTVGPISQKTHLPRTKVYETLYRLQEKGLIHYTVVSKTRHFEAANPQEIIRGLDERKKQLTHYLREIQLRRQNQPQTAIVHEGYKAVKALYNNLIEELKPGDCYRVFAFLKEYQTTFAPLFLKQVHRKISEKKIKDRVLAHTSIRKEINQVFGDLLRIQIRLTQRKTPLGTVIIPGKVIQLVWGERPTAIEIRSEQIHDHYKMFFDEMWKEAKK